MRVCPVCHARAFDDAEVCYGCMHRFSGKEPAAAPMPGGAHKGGAVPVISFSNRLQAVCLGIVQVSALFHNDINVDILFVQR